METDNSRSGVTEQPNTEHSTIPNRWDHLRKILERESPFDNSGYAPNKEVFEFVSNECRVLVVGAGGLGCELLKDLCLMGFRHIDVIDMDTIELSNLNRQFLFRTSDIGKPKATVAAEFVNKRVLGAKVCGHHARIQDFSSEFYRQFNVVVCGLDSVLARRWINAMLVSLLDYDSETGNLIESSVIPLVDGGTEGLKGNVRVILPGMSACLECQLDLYPPPLNYPLCTVAQTPRLPEHCVEWVKVLLWPREWPFGNQVPIDGDDPQHIQWCYGRALERCQQYGIGPLTYRLTQGVIKRIIPAVASTNACIAAACANEVFKLATSCASVMNNYMVLNLSSSIYTYTFELERKNDCLVCSRQQRTLSVPADATLRDVVELLCADDGPYQMKAPAITTCDPVSDKHRTLYMKSVASLEEATRVNLRKTLAHDLDLSDGQQLHVVDVTHPSSLIFTLRYTSS